MPPVETDQPSSVVELLGNALQNVVFGNGYLIFVIFGIFGLAVLLSRVFKGGSL